MEEHGWKKRALVARTSHVDRDLGDGALGTPFRCVPRNKDLQDRNMGARSPSARTIGKSLQQERGSEILS